jgi:hypothetical protein
MLNLVMAVIMETKFRKDWQPLGFTKDQVSQFSDFYAECWGALYPK